MVTRARRRPAPLRTTLAVRLVAALCFLYGVTAAALGVWLIVALASGQSLVADVHVRLVLRGVSTAIIYSLVVGAVLIAEAFLVFRGARGLGVVIVAGLVTIGGVAGEVIEVMTGGNVSSLLIGAGIIIAVALPVVVLLLPRPVRSTPRFAEDPPAVVTPQPRP